MLTRRQKDALEFIDRYQRTHGYSPAIPEIRDALGLTSKASAHRALRCLEDRGFIRRMPRRKRSIEVLRRAEIARRSDGRWYRRVAVS